MNLNLCKKNIINTMKENRKIIMDILLIVIVINIILNILYDAFDKINFIVGILHFFVASLVGYGIAAVSLKIVKKKNSSALDVLSIGGNRFKRAVKIYFFIGLKVIIPFILVSVITYFILWLFLFQILAGLDGTMTLPLMILSFILQLLYDLKVFSIFIILILGIMLLLGCFSVYIWIISPFVLAEFIAIDHPKMNEKNCVSKSKELMVGHRMEYYKLLLPNIILALIPPFESIITATFYKELIKK